MIKYDLSCYIKNPVVPCPAGDKEKDVHRLIYRDHTNNKMLVKTGVYPIQEHIQSYKESTCLTSLIKKFKAGQIDVFDQKAGAYIDASGISQDLRQNIEALRRLQGVDFSKVGKKSDDQSVASDLAAEKKVPISEQKEVSNE